MLPETRRAFQEAVRTCAGAAAFLRRSGLEGAEWNALSLDCVAGDLMQRLATASTRGKPDGLSLLPARNDDEERGCEELLRHLKRRVKGVGIVREPAPDGWPKNVERLGRSPTLPLVSSA